MDYIPVRDLVRTPIDMLNIYSGGGLQFNSIIEAWGNPASGKSTFCYQTLGYLLEDYGDKAEILILDVEASANELRLSKVFGITPGFKMNEEGVVKPVPRGDPRVTLCHAPTVEGASTRILKAIIEAEKRGRFLGIVWDSLTASSPAKEHEETEKAAEKGEEGQSYVGGMMYKPRVVKAALNSIIQQMWYTPVILFIVNQASTYIGRFTSGETSTGGYGLKHNVHYKIYFDHQKSLSDDDDPHVRVMTHTLVTVEKSKNSPKVVDIPIYIRDTTGGRIDPVEEIARVAYDKGWFIAKGGWYSFKDPLRSAMLERYPDLADFFDKSWRWSEFVSNSEDAKKAREVIREYLQIYARDKFFLVNEFYAEKDRLKIGSESQTE